MYDYVKRVTYTSAASLPASHVYEYVIVAVCRNAVSATRTRPSQQRHQRQLPGALAATGRRRRNAHLVLRHRNTRDDAQRVASRRHRQRHDDVLQGLINVFHAAPSTIR